jgi:flagellar biosynthesis protein FlhA
VHISDNLRLKPREYVFSLRAMEIGRWQTEGNLKLAVSGDPNRRPLAGKEAREPAFGVPAIWIAAAIEEQASAAGYSVVDAVTVITTHLGELIRQHAWELLGRAETKRLLDSLNDSHPKLLEELVPKLLTLGEVERVLEQLLRERVSIRDLGTILEALIETAPANKSSVALVRPRARRWAAGWCVRWWTTRGCFRSCCSTQRSKKRSWPPSHRTPASDCSACAPRRPLRWYAVSPIL